MSDYSNRSMKNNKRSNEADRKKQSRKNRFLDISLNSDWVYWKQFMDTPEHRFSNFSFYNISIIGTPIVYARRYGEDDYMVIARKKKMSRITDPVMLQ
jgi:hypothetical protein